MKKINCELLEMIDAVVFALVAVMMVFTLLCRIYVVDGDSMKTTLLHEDRLLVSQLFYTPKQGDVVCFVAGENLSEKILVKRIIATEGQTIDITDDFRVMVDGALLEEDYLDLWQSTDPKHFVFPYTVKEGEVFCMGDNRMNSKDSRDLGPIETKYLLGKVVVRLMPNFGKVN